MRIWTPANACAPSAARSGWACVFSFAARRAARPDGSPVPSGCSNARSTTASSRATCCCRSWSSSSPPATARPRTRPRPSAAEIGERFGDADLIACARHHAGPGPASQQGQVEQGLALLDEAMVAVTAGELSPAHDGLDLLQRDRGLSGGVRARPRPRVDLRPGAVVRGATRDGRLHRRLPGASRRDHAAARRLAGRDRGGAARLRALPRGSTSRPPPRRSTSRRRCTACAASSRRPRRRTEARASGAWNRSRAWPCCGWRKDAPMPRPLRSAAP